MRYLNKFTESLNDSTEKNYLIAEFMCMKPHDVEEMDGFWTNTIKAHKYDSVANLQFDTDFMQVVDKIDSLGVDMQEYHKRGGFKANENNEIVVPLKNIKGN